MLSSARRRIPRHLPRQTIRCPRLPLCRHESTDSKPPIPLRNDAAPSGFQIDNNFSAQTLFTVDVIKRFIKYTVIGLVTVTVTTWTAFEGAHQWVENVELLPETDEEVRKWEWDMEAERWTGGLRGGTDPALGYKGRHALRSAWMEQHWGTAARSGQDAVVTKSFTPRGSSGAVSLTPIEVSLERAEAFLATAISAAEQTMSRGKLRPMTITELMARHADVMERMGSRDALFEARSDFERVWAGLPGKGLDATRIALKLGDLNRRLGDKEDALAWWARAIQLAQGAEKPLIPPTVPESLPSSPLAQRTLISTLVSLSAFYATSGELHQAKVLEESSLNLLRSLSTPPASDSASPPQALHSLYILHRSSLFSIHLAEVLYALKTKSPSSIEWLSRAAESSERVALALTGLPPVHPDAPQSRIPHPPSSETSLIADYAKSRSMRPPAQRLLRDARRTAAEAWNLIGILTEGSRDKNSREKALECYERALGWAGVAADQAGNIGKPGEGTLESEWKFLWANYVRARDAVRKGDSK